MDVVDFLKERAMKYLLARMVIGWTTPAFPYGGELMTGRIPRSASLDMERLYRDERMVNEIHVIWVIVGAQIG